MQAFVRSATKALAVFCVCASSYAAEQRKNNADSDVSQLAAGRIGALFIGMPPAEIEKRLQKSLEMRFAGEGRAGLTLERPAELLKLQLRTFMDTQVEGIDVFFTERAGVLHVDFISVAVPCQAVTSLQARLKAALRASAADQAETNHLAVPKRPFRWAAESKPTCRVWLMSDRADG